jgi:hypothetical protein
MLNTMFNPSNENANVKKLMRHMLQKMDFGKYQKFLQTASQYPDRDHKFVVFDYVESPSNVLISRSERIPGSRMSIHSIIQTSDFDESMSHIFGRSDRISWYTRRKIDRTKPFRDQPTDTRQLVVITRREVVDEEDYSDMPPLIPVSNNFRPILNPEDYTLPSPVTEVPIYNYTAGLNQTMWSPINFNNVATTSTMIQ